MAIFDLKKLAMHKCPPLILENWSKALNLEEQAKTLTPILEFDFKH